MTQEEFLANTIKHMNQNGLSVHFSCRKRVKKCAGLFDYPHLYVATGRPLWIEVYVHEYSHFLQYLDEQAKKPVNYPAISDDEYYEWWELFGNGFSITGEKLTNLRRKIQQMERDCDERAF